MKETLKMGSRQMPQWKTFEGANAEQKALRALAWMADYYLGRNHDVLDNLAESSGELALQVLAEHGLVTWLDGGVRFASWTDLGRRLLDRFE